LNFAPACSLTSGTRLLLVQLVIRRNHEICFPLLKKTQSGEKGLQGLLRWAKEWEINQPQGHSPLVWV